MSDLSQYEYELPAHLIAQQPVQNRVDARLMVVDRRAGSIEHLHIRDLPELMRPGDLMILNDSKVIPARLVGFRTATGGRWQGLYLEHDTHGFWRILSKTRGRLEPAETVTLEDARGQPHSTLRLVTRLGQGEWIAQPTSNMSAYELLEQVGRVPLPHYIRGGEMLDQDRQRYQTVYAERPGSIAAPTAGLHFSQQLLEQLRSHAVQIEHVTLHVGIGTFRPIASSTLEDHVMHSETGEISARVAQAVRDTQRQGGRVVAVGTTAVRVLETAALQGVGGAWSGQTDLFIKPPYRFQAIGGLLTNFHLPRSTLFVLVCTFGGHDLMRQAYALAIAEEYRFYSYGDAMLIL